MSVKAILVFCAHALFIQSVFSYCVSGGNYAAGLSGYGLGAPALAAPAATITGSGLACGSGPGYGAGLGYGAGAGYGGLPIEVIPTSGGGLPVSSVSAIAPSGLSLTSENAFEGALSVAGELPFLSAVTLEGALPSGGGGAISYSCGNGVTAIESNAPSAAVIAPATAAYGSGVAAYGSGLAGFNPVATSLTPGLGYEGLNGQGCGCSY